MNFSEALLDICDKIESEVGETLGDVELAKADGVPSPAELFAETRERHAVIVGLLGQVRLIGKLLAPQPTPPYAEVPPARPPDWFRKAALPQARAEEQAARRQAAAEEGLAAAGLSCMRSCEGGDSDGVIVPFAEDAPVGAKTLLSGQVYVLGADRRLHFSEEETEKFSRQVGRPSPRGGLPEKVEPG